MNLILAFLVYWLFSSVVTRKLVRWLDQRAIKQHREDMEMMMALMTTPRCVLVEKEWD